MLIPSLALGKAQAVDVTRGETLLVHVTIAAANGDTVETTSDLYTRLSEAIDNARDLSYEVRIASYQLLYFNLSARLLVDARYTVENVLGSVQTALKATFAFAQRDFGQSVSAAEIISTMHRVSGVEAVDLDALYVATDSETAAAPTLASVLLAQTAHWESGDILPAELLLINETGITLAEMTS